MYSLGLENPLSLQNSAFGRVPVNGDQRKSNSNCRFHSNTHGLIRVLYLCCSYMYNNVYVHSLSLFLLLQPLPLPSLHYPPPLHQWAGADSASSKGSPCHQNDPAQNRARITTPGTQRTLMIMQGCVFIHANLNGEQHNISSFCPIFGILS